MSVKDGFSREQMQMICWEGLIEKDNAVRVIDALVDSLDVNQLGFESTGEANTGRPAYDVSDLLKLYLYGYSNRIRSSRQLELSCVRNIEVMWLLRGLRPKHSTIAAFRSSHPVALKNVFRHYVSLLRGWGLVEGKTVAVDSVKMRAQNSRKNNYNKRKVDQHLEYIDGKIRTYFEELREGDATESETESRSSVLLNNISDQLERRKKYEALDQALEAGDETQISTTDADARALPLRRKIVEVAYAHQTAVASEHKLIVNYKTTNRSDNGALSAISIETKEILGVEELDVLADKGYHSGEELKKCAEGEITTYVAPRASSQRGKKHPDFTKDKFSYQAEEDVYICPAGEQLTTSGKWYEKSSNARKKTYRFKKYEGALEVCTVCPYAQQCGPFNRSHGRYIERTEYDDHVEANRRRIANRKDYYRTRQAIVEHPFGTIKRQWGFTYMLLRSLEKVSGETALMFTCYNLRRSMSILGVEELIKRLKELFSRFSRSLRSTEAHMIKVIIKLLESDSKSLLYQRAG